MTWKENITSNFLAVVVVGGLFLIIYLKITKQTLTDLFQSMKEGFNE